MQINNVKTTNIQSKSAVDSTEQTTKSASLPVAEKLNSGGEHIRAYASAQINYRNKNDVNFEGKVDKIIAHLRTANSPRKCHVSVDEALLVLEKLGAKIRRGKGSHVVASFNGVQEPIVLKSNVSGNIAPAYVEKLIHASRKYSV